MIVRGAMVTPGGLNKIIKVLGHTDAEGRVFYPEALGYCGELFCRTCKPVYKFVKCSERGEPIYICGAEHG